VTQAPAAIFKIPTDSHRIPATDAAPGREALGTGEEGPPYTGRSLVAAVEPRLLIRGERGQSGVGARPRRPGTGRAPGALAQVKVQVTARLVDGCPAGRGRLLVNAIPAARVPGAAHRPVTVWSRPAWLTQLPPEARATITTGPAGPPGSPPPKPPLKTLRAKARRQWQGRSRLVIHH
jgi:hypothetical protein